MELPQYFTGYDADRLPYKSFRELCFSLQAYGVLRVIETSDYDYPKNYFSALVEANEGKFYILQNCFVPVLAFATKESEEFVFQNMPSFENIAGIQNSEIMLLSPSVLNENIENKHLKQLSTYEQKEVKGWLPNTVGGVLFSWYFD